MMKSAKSAGDFAGDGSNPPQQTLHILHHANTQVAMEEEHAHEELGAYIGEKAGVLANLMSGSNGRDKICALVQYTVQLYSVCMRHSNE
jgi:hypothetical protein